MGGSLLSPLSEASNRFSDRRSSSILPSETKASYVTIKPDVIFTMPLDLKTPINDSSIKALAGVSVWAVSTIVVTDTRVAISVALYDKASILD